MTHKFLNVFWLCLMALSLGNISATYTREESGENTKALYSAVNSIVGASETSRQHSKQTLDVPLPYHGVPGVYQNGPVNPSGAAHSAGYGLSGQRTAGYGGASSGSYNGGCTETGCPLPSRDQSTNGGTETVDVDDHRNPIGSDEETILSGSNRIDVRGGYGGNSINGGAVGGGTPLPQVSRGYGAGGAPLSQVPQGYGAGGASQGYGSAVGSGAFHGYGTPGSTVTSQGYGATAQPAATPLYGSHSYPYHNAPQHQPGYLTNSIDGGYAGNYPANYPPQYTQGSLSHGYPYLPPPTHEHPPPPAQPTPLHGHTPQYHHHHHDHGHHTLDHSLRTNTEYKEVGHHEGQFQGNAGYGYGSGYGGYNGMFNRPGF